MWTCYGLHIPSPTRVINVTDSQAERTTGQALLGWLLNRAKSLLCYLFREVIRNSTTEVSRPVSNSFISTLNRLKTKDGHCTWHGKNILLGLTVDSLSVFVAQRVNKQKPRINCSKWTEMSAWRYELPCLSIIPLFVLLMHFCGTCKYSHILHSQNIHSTHPTGQTSG